MFLLVPGVLLAVFRLPVATRRALAFSYSEPTVPTAFTANYVHLTVPHLLSNLAGYLLVAGVGYLLAVSNRHRTRFLTALAVILVVFPVPLSYLNLAFQRPGISLGFSGLNMALVGVVLVEFASYLETQFTSHFGVENAPAFFFVVMAFVALPYADMDWGFALTAVTTGLAVAYIAPFLSSYQPSLGRIRTGIGKQGYLELLLAVGILAPGFVVTAFPQNPVVESGIVNVYIHLVGFCLGFITVYSYILVVPSTNPREALPFEE